MKTYTLEISETLQKYGHCILPGIGRLEVKRFPAERSFQDNTLHPPAYRIILNHNFPVKEDDISVIKQIAHTRSITVEQAEKEWQDTAQLIREKLSTGSSVPLDGLGWLNLDDEGNIAFTSSLPLSQLYTPVSLKSTSDAGQKAPADTTAIGPDDSAPAESSSREMQEKTSLDLRAQSKARWWIAGSILVLLIVGWFTYKGTKIRERKNDTVTEILSQKQSVDEADRLDSITQSIDSMHRAHDLANDSIHYKIIFATYDSKEKAEHQYRKMKGWGHPVQLIAKDSAYELAWPFTSLPSDTIENKVKMMNLYGKHIHIQYDKP